MSNKASDFEEKIECSVCERPVVDWGNAAAKIKRFKQADIDREVLKMAEIASSICFVRQLIQKVDELEKENAELLEKIEELKDESLYWQKSSLGVL